MTFRRHLARILLQATTALTFLYTIGMLALSVIWKIAPERTWWLALSNVFAPFFFTPLLLIAPLALLLRSRALGVMTAVLALLFGIQFGQRLLPASQAAQTPLADPAQTVRVATFNQLYSNTDIPGTLAVIKAQKADIIALQELSLSMEAAIKADPELSSRYPYHVLWGSDQWWGEGVLSRYKIVYEDKAKDFNGQLLTLEVAGQQVHFINIHPPAPTVQFSGTRKLPFIRELSGLHRLPIVRTYITGRRNEQLQGLLKQIDRTKGPLIVAGDFNTADRDTMYTQLATRMQDSYAKTNWGFGRTFPNSRHANRIPVPFPLVRIDYIWTRGPINALSSRVVCDAVGSDHCMVVADLAVSSDG